MKPSVDKNLIWNYTKPAPLNRKILLLTHGNQCTVGAWKGTQLDQGRNLQYKAWFDLPDRDKELERMLELA